jgi:YVTN family beta-propeller protein
MINCLGSCHDLTSDFNNCGNCGYKCGAGQECVLSGCLTALPSHPVWVTNNAQVQVVDPAAGGGIVATIDVGGTTSDLAITPNRLKTYVTNIVSNNVSVISTASRAVTATIPVGTSPVHVAVTPDGSRVYVSNSGSKTLSVIDSTTDTVITSISLTTGVGGLAVKPDGTQLWVSAGYGPDILNVLSIPDHTVIHSAGAGSGFIGDFMRFLPNGSVLYAGSGCGCCGNVRLFNGTTFAAITTHSWGNPGAGVAISPSGPWVYGGATGSGCNGVSTLVKMDGQTGTILSQAALAVTSGMAISPDGTSLYVIQFNTTNLVVVDADSLAPVRTIVLGGTPGIGEVQ